MKIKRIFYSIKLFFSAYPPHAQLAIPSSFKKNQQVFFLNKKNSKTIKTCFQLVQDPFYFLLFGGIILELQKYLRVKNSAIVTQGISGAIGFNLRSEILRSAPIAWIRTTQWVRAYGNTILPKIAYRNSTWVHPLKDLYSLLEAIFLWKKFKRTIIKSSSLKYCKVEIGDLVVDTYLRFRPCPRFIISDLFVLKIIWQAIRDIKKSEKYFAKEKPDVYFSSYSVYLEHGIPVRVAIKHNINTYVFGNFQIFAKKLTKIDYYQTANCDKYKRLFSFLSHKEKKFKKAEFQLNRRLSGKNDAATFYMKKVTYSKDVMNIKLKKSFVVIFLHDFYDSPHVYKNFIFVDFWQWLIFTIRVLKKNNINFYIKTHPNKIKLNDKIIKDLKLLIPERHWLPKNINTKQLVSLGMKCGITAYGTVSHELAYQGVHSICCARHPHHSFDFCKTANNKKEYELFLKDYYHAPISKVKMRKQALAFYYMHNLHGTSDELNIRSKFLELYKASCNKKISWQKVFSKFDDLTSSNLFKKFCKKIIFKNQLIKINKY
jgi:hypothetical protein